MYLFIYAVKSQYIVEMDRQWVGSGEGVGGLKTTQLTATVDVSVRATHRTDTHNDLNFTPMFKIHSARQTHAYPLTRKVSAIYFFFFLCPNPIYIKKPFVNSPCHFAVTPWHAQTFVQLGRSGIGTCPRSKGLERKSFSIEPGITFWGKQLFPRNLLMSQNIFTFSAPGLALWNWS